MGGNWRNALWTQFKTRAAELGLESIRFPIYFNNRPDERWEVEFFEEQLYLDIDERARERLTNLDRSAILARLKDETHTNVWLSAIAQVENGVGTKVSLNAFATAVLVPTIFERRTTVHINVYLQSYVDIEDIEQFLLPEQLGTLRPKRGKRLPLRKLGLELFPEENATTGSDKPGTGELPPDTPAPEPDDNEPDDDDAPSETWTRHRNMLFMGPPGTGKSRKVADIARKFLSIAPERTIRVTFHPETSYYDFVGSYRPTVGWLKTAGTFYDSENQARNVEPRTYYSFSPGPLSQALALAAKAPGQNVMLIIEELNRGNVAAIFGDVLQLLDRNTDSKDRGWSTYAIQPSSEWHSWLKDNVSAPAFEEPKLRLPPNLYLYATMNTSDQSLFPIDTAFRRRWGLEYVGIDAKQNAPALVPLHMRDHVGVQWTRVMTELNARIVDYTRTDDKQMGPWFVRASSASKLVDTTEFESKVLFYLWSEVFRDRPAMVFKPELTTYEKVLREFREGRCPLARDIVAALRGDLTDMP